MAKQSKRKHTQTAVHPPAARIKAIDKLLERGDIAAARKHIERLSDKYPAYPPLLRRYLEVLLELGEMWHAGTVARQWTELQLKSVLAWQQALECYLYNHLLLLAHEAAQQLHSMGEEIPPELLEIDENKALDKGPFGQVAGETLRRHELGLL